MTTLRVGLGESTVGALEYFEDTEEYRFSFDERWLRDPDRHVLGQIFEERRPKTIEYVGPPCWFSHLLPQGALRRAITRALGVTEDAATSAEFALYEFLGADLPGAVLLEPTKDAASRRSRKHPLVAVGERFPWRSSLAGMQLKMSVRKRERGIVLPVVGAAGNTIAKFHSPDFKDLPRVEHATMSWARDAGVETPRFELVEAAQIDGLSSDIPTGDGWVYLIERFDRGDDETRVHFEDFAQVLDRPLDRIYENSTHKLRSELIAAVLAAHCPEDVRAFVERLTFCVLAGNGDAHLKNWALCYPDGRRARLSPAYDLVSTILYPAHLADPWLALSIGSVLRFDEIRDASFEPIARVSERSFAEVAAWVREAAERTRAAWTAGLPHSGFLPVERKRIEAHLESVSLP